MRKVFLDELPKWKKGQRCRGKINWKASIGYKIKFIYDDIEGKIEILDVTNNYIKAKYKDNIQNIYVGSFVNCNIGVLIGKILKKYKYNINDIIETCTGSIKILNQTIKINNRGEKRKSYKYKCLNCGNEDFITEDHLWRRNGGCNTCCPSPRKVLKGYNDIATTSPWIIEWLFDKNDAYKYTQSSNKSILFKCKECGHIKEMTLNHFISNGFGCLICGDGVSYAEKYMISLLKQLQIDFICQYNPEWIKPKRYDFFIPEYNMIIETHGDQHYNEVSGGKWGKLNDIKEKDKFKKQMAIKNNIYNYIIIDCRDSDLNFIKNNILNSKLNKMLNLSNINWEKCNRDACSNLIKLASELWKYKTKDTREISNYLDVALGTVIDYLKKAKILGWCDYDKKITREMITKPKISGLNHYRAKKTICLNTSIIFNTLSEAAVWCNIKGGEQIGQCCNNKKKSAGKHPITGEKLRWMYYDDYLKQQQLK